MDVKVGGHPFGILLPWIFKILSPASPRPPLPKHSKKIIKIPSPNRSHRLDNAIYSVSSPKNSNRMVKVLVCGPTNAGKTSIASFLADSQSAGIGAKDKFYDPTIG